MAIPLQESVSTSRVALLEIQCGAYFKGCVVVNMEIQVIQTTEDFFDLRLEWNALLESSVSNCVFLTHEWLFAWWKHLAESRRLVIMAARDRGKLIGILPLVERPPQPARMMPRVVEFMSSGLIGADYLDV